MKEAFGEEEKNADEKKNSCNVNRGVLLRVFPPFLALLFFIGLWLGIEPCTRRAFIVIYVPVFALVFLLYAYVLFRSDVLSAPVPPTGTGGDDVVLESPALPFSVIDLDNGTDRTYTTARSDLSETIELSARNSDGDDNYSVLSTVSEALSEVITGIGGSLRRIVYNPWLPPPSTLLTTGSDDSITTTPSDSLGENGGGNNDSEGGDASTTTEDRLTVPDGGGGGVGSDPAATSDDDDRTSRNNLTGTYKLVSTKNFDSFLKAMDVPWALRKAANLAKPIHTYTHTKDMFRVQIDGIIKGDTTYIIDGPPVSSTIRHIELWDTVSYLDTGDGVMVRKVAKEPKPGDPKELILRRVLSKDRAQVRLLSKAVFPDGRESLEAEQVFQRVAVNA